MAVRTTLRGLSICSGVGGIDLGLKLAMGAGYRTVCYIEREAYAAAVLVARMQSGALCEAPVWSNLKTFNPKPWVGCVDIISAGYPCQPFSRAGRRRGTEDPRHLWPYIARIAQTLRPRYLFLENVEGHVSLGLDVVAQELQAMDYDVSAGIFTAAECGAPHVRKRLFLLAHAHHIAGRQQTSKVVLPQDRQHPGPQQRQTHSKIIIPGGDPQRECQRELASGGQSRAKMADRHRLGGRPGQPQSEIWQWLSDDNRGGGQSIPWCQWGTEPTMGRLVNGLPNRVDRVRALGNAVVPDVACRAWQTLSGISA